MAPHRVFQNFSAVSNRGLIAAGAMFFLFQMHGYLHAVNPDDFGFPEDNHFHIHEAMEMEQENELPGSEYRISTE